MNNIPHTDEIFNYDWKVKLYLNRVKNPLYQLMNSDTPNKNWKNVIITMFKTEGNEEWMNRISVGGYYSSVRKILKLINVIRYEGKKLTKGENWDRFYSDEDWSWFVSSTDLAGRAVIIK